MDPLNFCYWLKGYFELTENIDSPYKIRFTSEQAEIIQRHLKMVFDRQPKVGPCTCHLGYNSV